MQTNKTRILIPLIGFILCLLAGWLTVPSIWLPKQLSEARYRFLGEPSYQEPPRSKQTAADKNYTFCPESVSPSWRQATEIEGVEIDASPLCQPDNPFEVAASVLGTNNVSSETLRQTMFSADSVVKTNDRDNDGDPDDIHIRLEVSELNGFSPELSEFVSQYEIAPGIKPGFWVFSPKSKGMATANALTLKAQAMLRMPSVPIRVEQGDTVKITLENTHYMPHTIHLHGVDHPFRDANGEGNDGVPMVSEIMLMPGSSRTYDFSPRQAGTMFYHCHVQPQAHLLMGLGGFFIIEENRKNNHVQTFNIGAGQVRHRSQAIKEEYQREYDLHYQDVDSELHQIVQQANDPRLIAKEMNQVYNVTQRKPDYFLLNGKSFPYTLRESLIVVGTDERIKLRVLNGGSSGVSLHTHGHKVTVTHWDGVPLPEGAQIMRDVVFLSAAQRTDLTLDTTNDGLNSYGPGAWFMHDHREEAVTTNGINPGGDISMIVYEEYLGEAGKPKTEGELGIFFDPEFYAGRRSLFGLMAPDQFGEPEERPTDFVHGPLSILLLGLSLGCLIIVIRRV